MKVLIGPNNVANQAFSLAKHLRESGVDATCFTYGAQNRFFGDTDWAIDLELTSLVGSTTTQEDLIAETVETALQDGYDIFHFFQSSFVPGGIPMMHNLLKGIDLPLLKVRGKKVLYRFTGWELRSRELDLERNPFSPYKYGIKGCLDPEQRDKYLEFLKGYVDAFVVTDPQMQENLPEARIIPRILDLSQFPEIGIGGTSRPLVVHAPSNREAKGTDIVLESLKRLEESGISFELKLIENMPFAEAFEWYKKADVIIDQILIGWHGVLTIEGLALGKPVAVYVREDLLKDSEFSDLPICNINPGNIDERLRELIGDARLRKSLSERGRDYIARHHDVGAVIPRLKALYDEVQAAPPRTPENEADLRYLLPYRTQIRQQQQRINGLRRELQAAQKAAPKPKSKVEKEADARRLKQKPLTPRRALRRVYRFLVRLLPTTRSSEALPETNNPTLRSLRKRLQNFEAAIERMKSANSGLRALHEPWSVFLVSSCRFGQNGLDLMRKAQFRPDVIIGHDVTALETMEIMRHEYNCRTILDAVEFPKMGERSGNFFRTYSANGAEIVQNRVDTLIGRADAMITVGPGIARRIEELYGCEVGVVMNCRDDRCEERSGELRERIGARPDDVVCLFPNLAAAGYGFEEVAEAIGRLPENYRLVHIGRIAGMGYEEALMKRLDEANLHHRISFLGQVSYEDVPRLYSGADLGIIALQPQTENIRLALPNRFFDLVAGGVPVLTSPIQDIAVFVQKNRLGAVFDTVSPDSIAEAIHRIEPDLAECRRNMATFAARTTWQAEMDKVLALIPDQAQRVALIVKKDISNHGRTRRLVRGLRAAGKEVLVIAPAGALPESELSVQVVHARDYIINKG